MDWGSGKRRSVGPERHGEECKMDQGEWNLTIFAQIWTTKLIYFPNSSSVLQHCFMTHHDTHFSISSHFTTHLILLVHNAIPSGSPPSFIVSMLIHNSDPEIIVFTPDCNHDCVFWPDFLIGPCKPLYSFTIYSFTINLFTLNQSRLSQLQLITIDSSKFSLYSCPCDLSMDHCLWTALPTIFQTVRYQTVEKSESNSGSNKLGFEPGISQPTPCNIAKSTNRAFLLKVDIIYAW